MYDCMILYIYIYRYAERLTGAKRKEFSGMIPVITSKNHPISPFPSIPY